MLFIYSADQNDRFFNGLVKYFSSGPIFAMVSPWAPCCGLLDGH